MSKRRIAKSMAQGTGAWYGHERLDDSTETENMRLRTDNRILLVSDKYGNRVPLQIEKICRAILKAAAKVGGFALDIREEINSPLLGGRTDEDIAEFLAHDVLGRLNSNPQYLTPNTPAPLDEIHRCVIETLRFWGLRTVADEYQFYSSARLWVRRRALDERHFSHVPYPQELVDEASRFNAAHDCDTVDGINRWVRGGRLQELINAAIERYDEQLAIATRLMLARPGVRLLVIAGPSSSGKTTTTTKITELVKRDTGKEFVVFSADNYFYGVELHPADQYGDRDYERARAYEITLMRSHLLDLLEGRTIQMPVFDFKAGTRVGTKPVSARPDQIIILDCLHGLYPYITQGIPDHLKFNLYICNANRVLWGDGSSSRSIPFTLVNMIRRILRDSRHRDKGLLATVNHWHYVRDGELTDMNPFVRTAHAYVNGGLAFDLPVLKRCLSGRFPSIDSLPHGTSLDAYLWTLDGSRLLSSVEEAPVESLAMIPGDCHIREFIGGLDLEIAHQH